MGSVVGQLPKDILDADLVLRLNSEVQPLCVPLACYVQVEANMKIKLLTFLAAPLLKRWFYTCTYIYIYKKCKSVRICPVATGEAFWIVALNFCLLCNTVFIYKSSEHFGGFTVL